MGWDGPNGDIRDFSSGQFSAESLRTYQDFITIHHGDPVVQLETFATTQHGFDGGVGTQVYASDREIADIAYADLNHDGDKDLVVVHSDGSIGLRLDPGGDNLNIGDVAQLLDLDTSRVVTGDFFGDGYADIAFTTKT